MEFTHHKMYDFKTTIQTPSKNEESEVTFNSPLAFTMMCYVELDMLPNQTNPEVL